MAGGVRRHLAIGREQGQLGRALRRLIERLDDPAPSRPLAVVDLAQIEHLPLHHPAAGATLALDNVPIEMLFAVFAPPVRLQVHAADSTPTAAASQGLGLDYSRFRMFTP